MIWLTNPVPDFDTEKRRRWYAFVMAFVGASSFIIVVSIHLFSGLNFTSSNEPVWAILLFILAVWFFFFVFKYAAAYAIWYKPYASRKRAICLSILAIFSVYFFLLGAGTVYSILRGEAGAFGIFFEGFWKLHKLMYGVPYFTAALVGLRFARPAPDARDSF